MPLDLGIPGAALQSVSPYITAGFFLVCTVATVIVLHLLGARIFMSIKDRGGAGPWIFGWTCLALGAATAVAGVLSSSDWSAMLLGLLSGFLLWTALGEVGQEMGRVSVLDRSAVPSFLASAAIWLLMFLFRGIPHAVLTALGYPVCVWGLNLARVRVISKWGPSSLPATLLALVTAAVAGGGVAAGVLLANPVSGILGGVVFAMSTWSVLEIIWERGTALRPWRQRRNRRGDQ